MAAESNRVKELLAGLAADDPDRLNQLVNAEIEQIRAKHGTDVCLELGIGTGCKLAPSIITRSLRETSTKHGVEEAVDRWVEIARGSRKGACIVLVSGVAVKEPIELHPGVYIAPLEHIGSTSYAIKKKWHSRMPRRFMQLSGGLENADAAIVSEHPTKTFMRCPPVLDPDREKDQRTLQLLLDLSTLLVLCWPAAPLEVGHWWEPARPFFRNDVDGPLAGQISDIPAGLDPTVLTPSAIKDLRPFIASWQKQDEAPQKTLRIALRRLRQAARRAGSVDSAIELGISMEALLLRRKERNLSRKIALRAACILGGTENERAEYQKTFRLLYQLRSDAVHSGEVSSRYGTGASIPERFHGQATSEVLKEGRRLVTRIAIDRITLPRNLQALC